MTNKVACIVVGEFASRVVIDRDDLEKENYDEIVRQFSNALLEKISNGEVLENITSIEEDRFEPYVDGEESY